MVGLLIALGLEPDHFTPKDNIFSDSGEGSFSDNESDQNFQGQLTFEYCDKKYDVSEFTRKEYSENS